MKYLKSFEKTISEAHIDEAVDIRVYAHDNRKLINLLDKIISEIKNGSVFKVNKNKELKSKYLKEFKSLQKHLKK